MAILVKTEMFTLMKFLKVEKTFQSSKIKRKSSSRLPPDI